MLSLAARFYCDPEVLRLEQRAVFGKSWQLVGTADALTGSGAKLVDDSDFAKSIDSHKPGDSVELSVVRGTQTLQIKATLAKRPAQ